MRLLLLGALLGACLMGPASAQRPGLSLEIVSAKLIPRPASGLIAKYDGDQVLEVSYQGVDTCGADSTGFGALFDRVLLCEPQTDLALKCLGADRQSCSQRGPDGPVLVSGVFYFPDPGRDLPQAFLMAQVERKQRRITTFSWDGKGQPLRFPFTEASGNVLITIASIALERLSAEEIAEAGLPEPWKTRAARDHVVTRLRASAWRPKGHWPPMLEVAFGQPHEALMLGAALRSKVGQEPVLPEMNGVWAFTDYTYRRYDLDTLPPGLDKLTVEVRQYVPFDEVWAPLEVRAAPDAP